jgi:hypothetical protein
MLRQIAAAVPEAREYINIDDIFDKAFPTSAGEETAWLLPFGFESRADIPTELHHDFIILLQAFKLGGDKWENARDKFLERQGNAGL